MGLISALKSVEHQVARFGEKVVDSKPVASLLPGVSDRADQFLQRFAGYDFPKTVSVPRVAATGTVGPTKLDAQSPAVSFGLRMNQTGDARVDLTAAGPGTDWAKKGAESAVMSVYVDGRYQQDVVLSGGAAQTPYALSLGQLSQGDHSITLRFAKEKSNGGATGIDLAGAKASAVTYPSREAQWAAENAPVLIGRNGLDNNRNDTPLGMFHRVSRDAQGNTHLCYGFAFSNEDTGDGGDPALEQARWGRLTDLQNTYAVTLDPSGKVLSRRYEGDGHVWHDFKGELDGTHAVIRTATENNTVADRGRGPLRFRFPADNPVGDFPTEDLMRRHPEWFAVETQELQREGKLAANGRGDAPRPAGLAAEVAGLFGSPNRMADPRDYVYVQLDASGAGQAPVTARVTLNDGRTFDSNLGEADADIARDGWAQTAVRLPPGTTRSDIAKVSFDSGGARIDRVGCVYMLDRGFKPLELPRQVISK